MKKLTVIIILVLIQLSLFSQLGYSQIEFVDYSEKNKIDKFNDYFQIYEKNLENQIIYLSVSYSGGCEAHEFFYTSNQLLNSNTLNIYIHHNANDDECEAMESQNLIIDLSDIIDESVETIQIMYPQTDEPIAVFIL